MRTTGIYIAAVVMMGVLLTGIAGAADQPMRQVPNGQGDDAKLPNCVIGVSLQIGAERISDPACHMSGWFIRRDPLSKQGLDMETKS